MLRPGYLIGKAFVSGHKTEFYYRLHMIACQISLLLPDQANRAISTPGAKRPGCAGPLSAHLSELNSEQKEYLSFEVLRL